MPTAVASSQDAMDQVLELLRNATLKPDEILRQLQGIGVEERDVREAIAGLLDKNAVSFDRQWRLQTNPVWGKKAA